MQFRRYLPIVQIFRKILGFSARHRICVHTHICRHNLDSGSTRVAARVRAAELPASVDGFLKARCTRGRAQLVYGGPAGSHGHGGCARPPRYTHGATSSLAEAFGHMPRGCRPSSEPFFTPSCTHDTRRRRVGAVAAAAAVADLCCPECRW